MKKVFKAVFMLSLIALPVMFTSCEKDHGTSGYGHYGDDDWKKYDGNDPTIEYEDGVSLLNPVNE